MIIKSGLSTKLGFIHFKYFIIEIGVIILILNQQYFQICYSRFNVIVYNAKMCGLFLTYVFGNSNYKSLKYH